jgi:GNAT superfamily N-acetyltransferase
VRADPQVRLALPRDALHFAAVEMSACERFRAIADLAWIANEAPTALDDALALIDAGTVWVAVESSGEIAGVLMAEACDQDMHICEFAVSLDRQCQGIGKLLIEAAVNHAKAAGLAAITLTTFRDVVWNEPYYQHMGFETLGFDQLDARLRSVFAREVLIGLPVERRCAMRLVL